MEIRKASINDIKRIKELYQNFSRQRCKLQPDYFLETKTSEEYLKELINNETSEFYLAIINNEIVGFILFNEQKHYPGVCTFERYGFLSDLMIDKNYRRQGIATKLMDFFVEWCKERNLEVMELNVLMNNQNAIALYEKYGFSKRTTKMIATIK